MMSVSSSTYYWCTVQSGDAVLSTQKLPRVASRGREVGKNVDKHRLGVNAECTQKSQIKCAEHLENLSVEKQRLLLGTLCRILLHFGPLAGVLV